MRKYFIFFLIAVTGLFFGLRLGDCAPVSCDTIAADQCPEDECALMINCRGEKICHFKMIDPPSCGNLSYEGQDVPCCPGMVRRCGVAFFDLTCDMHGDDSPYHLPVCIPCGDGICGNFENACNCPEDCHPDREVRYDGQRFDREAEPEDPEVTPRPEEDDEIYLEEDESYPEEDFAIDIKIPHKER